MGQRERGGRDAQAGTAAGAAVPGRRFRSRFDSRYRSIRRDGAAAVHVILAVVLREVVSGVGVQP